MQRQRVLSHDLVKRFTIVGLVVLLALAIVVARAVR